MHDIHLQCRRTTGRRTNDPKVAKGNLEAVLKTGVVAASPDVRNHPHHLAVGRSALADSYGHRKAEADSDSGAECSDLSPHFKDETDPEVCYNSFC